MPSGAVRLQKSCRGCFAEELSALHGKRFKAAMEGCVPAAEKLKRKVLRESRIHVFRNLWFRCGVRFGNIGRFLLPALPVSFFLPFPGTGSPRLSVRRKVRGRSVPSARDPVPATLEFL